MFGLPSVLWRWIPWSRAGVSHLRCYQICFAAQDFFLPLASRCPSSFSHWVLVSRCELAGCARFISFGLRSSSRLGLTLIFPCPSVSRCGVCLRARSGSAQGFSCRISSCSRGLRAIVFQGATKSFVFPMVQQPRLHFASRLGWFLVLCLQFCVNENHQGFRFFLAIFCSFACAHQVFIKLFVGQ
jgi:hypothetical protein